MIGSGNQRFRVPVSPALGISQDAGQGTRRIELVIFDESFGSLDKDGRREMIDEFHTLKKVLRRIILVSHQKSSRAHLQIDTRSTRKQHLEGFYSGAEDNKA